MINEAAFEDSVEETKIFCKCGHTLAMHQGCEMFCGKCHCITFTQDEVKMKSNELPEDWPQPPDGFAKDLPSIMGIKVCPKCRCSETYFKFYSKQYSWQYPKSLEDFKQFKARFPNSKWSDYETTEVCGEHIKVTCSRCEYFIGNFKCADAE